MKPFIFLVPLILDSWMPIRMGSQDLPQLSTNKNPAEWTFSTKGNAGGYAYFFEGEGFAADRLTISWQWKVAQFPNTNPRPPFDKSNDDYPLRVGVLLSGGKTLKFPNSGLQSKLEEKKISDIIFFGASVEAKESCDQSPYHDQIRYCLKKASEKWGQINVPISEHLESSPAKPKDSAKVVGLWIFADSDNSHSQSEASIREIKVTR